MNAKKQVKDEAQLSLFEKNEPAPLSKSTVLEFLRARFEQEKPMTPEEYKRWIKFLVNHSLRSMD